MRAFLVWPVKKCLGASQWVSPATLVVLITCSQWCLGQEPQPLAPTARPLITQAVDESQLTRLTGNTHPMARPEFDLGTAPATLPMDRMLLVLKRSPEQEAALEKLLDDQQDKNSPNYHKWLTPEEFGQRFGPSDADMQTITGWLQSHGFQVGSTKGRTVLEFSGSASQVQEAFQTTIHKYIVNGEQHWANYSDPSIPTALGSAVAGILTLHNFIKKPAIHWNSQPVAAKIVPGKKPQVTFPPQNGKSAINALAPSDYAVIYNINPIYSANNQGGATIAVVGRSNLYNSGQDVQDFRNVFSVCCFGNIHIILNGPDPGDLGGGEEAEATLDSTWPGAIAPGAAVDLVVSASTNTADGIDLSEAYIIENNIADLMTESFSSCELYATDAQLAGATALAEQAAAQGIAYIVSTGDDGAAGCDDPSTAPASRPVSVNFLASTAFNVAVGGTMFNENGNASKYWTSAAPFGETAISYIPEDVWNESGLTNGLWSSSGGASAGNIAAGGTTSGVPKPSWQSGVQGIPNDGVRDLPDVSLTAASHDPYLLCLEGSCVPNSQGYVSVYFISGTSAAAPSFAGIMALVELQAARVANNSATRLGPADYILYRLAATQSTYPSQCNASNTTTPPASACIFNDVTVGNNVVPGESGTQYQAGLGYDMATGLGSVNVANLVNQWSSVSFNPTTTTLSATATTITHGSPVPFTVTVTPNSGTGVPTGDVSLFAYSLGSFAGPSLGFWTLSGGSISSETNSLQGGMDLMAAQYAGDSTYAPSTSAGTNYFTVNAEPSTTTLSVLTANQNGQAIPFSSGPFGSFVYLRADVTGQSGHGVPSGTVTFADSFGTIPGGGTFALNSQGNTATPNGILTFDTGTHTISASYAGDSSFNSSSSTQNPSFTITPGFFASISSAQSTVIVAAPGGTGQTSVSVVNSTSFKGTITLACSELPSEATCTFAPASVVANGTSGNTPVSVTITTTAATAKEQSRRHPYLLAQGMMGLGLLLSCLFVGKRQGTRGMLLMILLTLMIIAPACGGGGSGGGGGNHNPPPNAGTPKGVSNVTVTATSGSVVSQTGFALVIQ